MFNLTLSPLTIFVILLGMIIVVLFMVGQPHLVVEEGFTPIAYNLSTAVGSTITVPQYSKTHPLTKIYDSVYMDMSNSNVVQFFGANGGMNGINDNSGSTLTAISVLPASGTNINTYMVPKIAGDKTVLTVIVPIEIAETSAVSGDFCWSYPGPGNYEPSNPYQIISISHGTYNGTYVYDILNKTMVGFLNSGDGSTSKVDNIVNYDGVKTVNMSSYIAEPNVPTNLFINGKYRYAVSADIEFNVNRQILLISNMGSRASSSGSDTQKLNVPPESIMVSAYYPGYHNASSSNSGIIAFSNMASSNITESQKTLPRVPPGGISTSNPCMITDKALGNTIFVQSTNNVDPSKSTISTLLVSPDRENNALLFIKNAVVFTPTPNVSQLETSETPNMTATVLKAYEMIPVPVVAPSTAINTVPVNYNKLFFYNADGSYYDSSGGNYYDSQGKPILPPNGTDPKLNNMVDNYYKRHWEREDNFTINSQNSADYILKTSVIPPTCPSCPICPVSSHNGANTCHNCGGNGGSGTTGSNGASLVYDASGGLISNTNSGIASATNNPGVFDASANNYSNPNYGTNNYGNNTIVGATGNIIGSTFNGASNMAGTTMTGVGNTIGSTFNGASNMAGTTMTGVGNTIGNTFNGASNMAGTTMTGVENVAGTTFNGVGNAIGSGFNGASNMVGSTVNGVGNVAGRTINGVGGVVGDTVNGVGNVAGRIVNGVEGVTGDTVNGVGNIIGRTGNAIGLGGPTANSSQSSYLPASGITQASRGTSGNYNGDVQSNLGYAGKSGNPGYNSYGNPMALTPSSSGGDSRGNNSGSMDKFVPNSGTSNFLPITASFSSFGK